MPYQYPVKRLIVGLDLTAIDATLIKYAGFVCSYTKVEKIYFLHVIRDYEVPKEVVEQFPGLAEPVDEAIEEEMRKKVEACFPKEQHPDVQLKFEVKEGMAAEAFVKMVKVKDVDMIVVGNKRKGGTGVLATRLGRSASCAVLIIPEKASGKIERILVPIDQSQHSNYAVAKATAIAKANPGAHLIFQNIYTVPSGYHRTGKSFTQFARVMRIQAEKHFKEVTKEIPLEGFTTHERYTLDGDQHPVPDILKVAKQFHADLLVIGARAISEARALFMRSTAERLIRLDDEYPLLIVRPKGHMAGIREALTKGRNP